MTEERERYLLDIEKEGGTEYRAQKKFHLDFLNSFLDNILTYFDNAKTDEEREEVFKTYTLTNIEICKDDYRDLLKSGCDQERKRFEIMSLYEQADYIERDVLRYKRQFKFFSNGKIVNIKVDDLIPSKHMMN